MYIILYHTHIPYWYMKYRSKKGWNTGLSPWSSDQMPYLPIVLNSTPILAMVYPTKKNNISHHLQTISKYKPITVEFSTSSLHPEQDAARHRSNDWPFVTCDSENLSLATPRHLDLIYVTCDSKNRSLATQAPFRSRQEKGWGGVCWRSFCNWDSTLTHFLPNRWSTPTC